MLLYYSHPTIQPLSCPESKLDGSYDFWLPLVDLKIAVIFPALHVPGLNRF